MEEGCRLHKRLFFKAISTATAYGCEFMRRLKKEGEQRADGGGRMGVHKRHTFKAQEECFSSTCMRVRTCEGGWGVHKRHAFKAQEASFSSTCMRVRKCEGGWGVHKRQGLKVQEASFSSTCMRVRPEREQMAAGMGPVS